MGQAVKLSASLVADARAAGSVAERSIAGQIEYWARIGRAVGGVLDVEGALRLKHRADGMSLADVLAPRSAEERRESLRAYTATQPFPHFEGVPGRKGLLAKIDADGTRTVGRFVGRVFRPVGKK
jgi:ParD-like antitoxin of type II bacterial toxin-antitoxin system